MTCRARLMGAVSALALGALVACGSGTPPTTPTQTGAVGQTVAPTTGVPGETSNAEGLCGVFTDDLAVAALGVPVNEPTWGDVIPRPNGIYCRYVAAGDANVNVQAVLNLTSRADCEGHAQFLGMREPIPGIGEVAYQMDRSHMADHDAFLITWANRRCVTVIIDSDRELTVLFDAAKAIASNALLWAP